MAAFPSKLSAGVYGRFEFDFACNRGHIFGETNLHGILNEVAASNFDPREVRVESGYPAPAIQRPSAGPGRKRELDFAVVERSTGLLIYALEAKWAGSSHCTEESILIDLCRLVTIKKASPSTTCLFVLAGGKGNVEKILNTGLLAPRGDPPRRLLTYPTFSYARRFFLSELGKHRAVIAERLPTVPEKVSSLLYRPSHEDTPNWTVLVWRITA